jgi:hypothetical protein
LSISDAFAAQEVAISTLQAVDTSLCSKTDTMALSVATPGIFWVNSGPLNATLFPYPDYVKWYEGVHTPDWMAAKKGAITAAWRFQSEDEDRTTPFLVVYKYPNISDFSAPEFNSVPLTHPSLPGGRPYATLGVFFTTLRTDLGQRQVPCLQIRPPPPFHTALQARQALFPNRQILTPDIKNYRACRI